MYKCYFAPNILDHSYQEQLIKNLKDFDVKVDGTDLEISFVFKVFQNQELDILHLHWLHPFFKRNNWFLSLLDLMKFFIKLIVIKVLGVKIVWTVHNIRNHENLYPDLDYWCSFWVSRLSDVLIAHCEAAKQEIIETFSVRNDEKVVVIPHGNYLNYYPNQISQSEARQKLEIKNDSLVFLFLGLIRPYKRVLELIDEFKKSNRSEQVELWIVGQVADENLGINIQNAIQNIPEITFIPVFVPDDEIQVYMNAADVAVFPYRDVLTSGSALLAMSFSRVCIAPRLGCINEILDKSGAFLYDPQDESGLLNALNQAILNQEKLNAMGQYNRTVAQKWDWNGIAQETVNIYHSLHK